MCRTAYHYIPPLPISWQRVDNKQLQYYNNLLANVRLLCVNFIITSDLSHFNRTCKLRGNCFVTADYEARV